MPAQLQMSLTDLFAKEFNVEFVKRMVQGTLHLEKMITVKKMQNAFLMSNKICRIVFIFKGMCVLVFFISYRIRLFLN